MSEKSKNIVSLGWALRKYMLPRMGIITIGLFLIVLRSLAGLVLPYSSKILIDDIIPNEDMTGLNVLLIVVISAIIVQAITSFSLVRVLGIEAQRLIKIMRTEVERKLLKLPISFFDNHKSGALVSRVMTDVEGVRNLVGTGLVQLVGGTITAIISVIYLINLICILFSLV